MDLTHLMVVLIVLGNIVASVKAFDVSALSPRQRLVQPALVWLVPVVGALACLAFASSQAWALPHQARWTRFIIQPTGARPKVRVSESAGAAAALAERANNRAA